MRTRVGVVERDREWLLQVDGDAGAQQVDRDLLVGPVGRRHDRGVDTALRDERLVGVEAPRCRRRTAAVPDRDRSRWCRRRDDRCGGGARGDVLRDVGALARADDGDPEAVLGWWLVQCSLDHIRFLA